MQALAAITWHKTSEQLPTCDKDGQVEVIMWSPGWATWLKGMYSAWLDGHERWATCDSESGRLESVDPLMVPEYWLAPGLPTSPETVSHYAQTGKTPALYTFIHSITGWFDVRGLGVDLPVNWTALTDSQRLEFATKAYRPMEYEKACSNHAEFLRRQAMTAAKPIHAVNESDGH